MAGIKSGRHPDKALTALGIKKIAQSGRYADGNGLYLVVDDSGAKRWLLRVMVQGKRRDIGLGGLSVVSLAEAREKALEYRKPARSGGDPLAVKRAASRVIPTFKAAAESVHAEREATWRNAKHGQQWINTLVQYVYPVLGDMRVDRIDTPDILRVLSPIWISKPETARRIRQRMGLSWIGPKRQGTAPATTRSRAFHEGFPNRLPRITTIRHCPIRPCRSSLLRSKPAIQARSPSSRLNSSYSQSHAPAKRYWLYGMSST